MKKLIYLFIIFPFVLLAQTSNFSVDNGKIFWQKIYPNNLTAIEIENKIKESGNFYEVEKNEDKLILKFKDLKPKYKEAGQSAGFASMYISGGTFFASCTIDFKEGKYRVTVSNIKYNFNYLSFATLHETPSINDLEQVGLKRSGNEFKNGFTKRDANVLDLTFDHLFDVSKYKKSDDSW